MEGVTVILSGPIQSGKSTIGAIIKQALIHYGYEVHVQIIADGEDITTPQLINATYNVGLIDGNAIEHIEERHKIVNIIEDCSVGEQDIVEEYFSDIDELPDLVYEREDKVILPKVSEGAKLVIRYLLEVGNNKLLPSKLSHYLSDVKKCTAEETARILMELFSAEIVSTDENMHVVLESAEQWKKLLSK